MSKQKELNVWLEKVAKIQQRINDGNEELTPLDDYIKECECEEKMNTTKSNGTKNSAKHIK